MNLVVWAILITLTSCSSFFHKEEPIVTVTKHIKDEDQLVRNNTGFKKRVLVLPFIDAQENERSENLRENARQIFVSELSQQSSALIVSAKDLKDDLSKMKKDGQYDLKKIAQSSSRDRFSSIIEGKIIDIKLKNSADQIGVIRDIYTTYEVIVRLRILNSRTENEVFNTVKTITLKESNERIVERVSQDKFFAHNPELVQILIKDAFLDFVPQIQAALNDTTWEGRIAALRGDKIYLNVGRISGVQVGDILKVVEDGTEIYDPEIGYHLGRIRGNIKGTLEIISYFGEDGAVATVHSGANFKESDRVVVFE